MTVVVTVLLRVLAFVTLFFFGAFALLSAAERERRAAWVAIALAIGTSMPLVVVSLLPAAVQFALLVLLGGGTAAALVAWFLPIGRGVADGGQPADRFDERDIMFARGRLRPGTPEYDAYYSLRPENRAGDDRTRALPGLESLDAEKAEPVAFAAAAASSALADALRKVVNGPVATEEAAGRPEEFAALVKDAARYFGALEVGIAELRAAHIYSHVGRDLERYGEEVDLDHRWAIAFSVEMDHAIMASAPEAPVLAESSRRYVDAAVVGVQLASMIRSLGFPARAHIDGNYRVIAPLVARDAGLGEIGRMGILMTPRLGPRVRLGIVTTDLPLLADPPGNNTAVLDFCEVCRKCADNCPTGSILEGPREPIGDGGLRWRIDCDTCYRYWNVIGTDCGRCMAVCPFSHPDSPAHNLVRWAIDRSGAARRTALWMDDLFYGRFPATREVSIHDYLRPS